MSDARTSHNLPSKTSNDIEPDSSNNNNSNSDNRRRQKMKLCHQAI